MPSPHDPTHQSSTGLAIGDEGAETGNRISTKDEGTMKAARRPPRFWLGLAALLLGLATLAIVFFFFSTWSGVLAAEGVGAGLALLATCFLLVTGVWRDPASQRASSLPDGALDLPGETAPAATLEPTAVSAPEPTPSTPAAAIVEPPAAPAETPAPEPAVASAAPPLEQPEAAEAAPPATLEAAPAPEAAPTPARKPTRPRPAQPTHNGHSGELEAVRPKGSRSTGDDPPVAKPSLTTLPQSYPRPSGGFALDIEAEDLSQLLGDVSEQTVIAIATRGQRGVERRERMAGKIDSFSQEMSVDPDYAPVVAFLESISALLRAGKPIQPSRALVDPFDGLYGYVLTLIRRKTGQTHD